MTRNYPSLLLLALCALLTACTASQSTKSVADTNSQPAVAEAVGARTLTDFATNDLNWRIEDDRVMGGVSRGNAEITDNGHLRFWGEVSLENNGGFSSVQSGYDQTYTVEGLGNFVLRLKGDGKDYTFRVKRARSERHSYAHTFPTSGEWETVTIPFNKLTPTFRGYTPDLPAYAGEPINQLRILIGNKKPQSFELLVDEIAVR